MTDSPIEDYLDDLLRHTRADARTTRRLLDEASDHLHAAAGELHAGGMAAHDAESEAVRRFGPVAPIARATMRRAFGRLVLETARAALFLGSCGLIAVGLSGLVALVMNLSCGPAFVGGVSVFPAQGHSIAETADDAVVLRVLAGGVGLLALLGHFAVRRRASSAALLPVGLVDALGAAAFAAGTGVLTIAAVDQAVQNGTSGVGFALSGALIALPATVFFCVRAAKALLPPGARAASARRS
jgi:hypothetical protein